jgi:signal transduction histidine kinase
LSASLTHLEQQLGTLHVARGRAEPPFQADDAEILEMFATHAALVIQNDRLYDEVRALAVEHERQALAHEMHDSLAQVLAFVNTKAQAVEQYLRNDDAPAARQQMAELSAAAREVYGEIREGIAALRIGVGTRGLRQMLEEYLEHFVDSTPLELDSTWEIDDADLALTPAAEVQLLRIVQEALTNVRRHAHASRVKLHVGAEGDQLVVSIRDDGRGFDPAARERDGRPRFGLQTMSERAAAVGAELTVESRPGAGTAVTVRMSRAVQQPSTV